MKKIFQIMIEDENPSNVVKTAEALVDRKAEWRNICKSVNAEITEVDKKNYYTEDDDFKILASASFRISKDSSPQFIAGFATMIAYWNKLKDEGDEWLYWSTSGMYLRETLGRLQTVSCFLSRMKGLKYEGHIEAKLEVWPATWSAIENPRTLQDCKDSLLDKHAKLLDWTVMTEYTPV